MSVVSSGPSCGLGAQPEPQHEQVSRHILELRVDALTYSGVAAWVLSRARRCESHYICVANVHMVMETVDDPGFREIVNGAGLVTPDGMPLVWGLRCLGVRDATRVYGPELVPVICGLAAREKVPVGFYGGEAHVLKRLVANLTERFPGLTITFAESPPFGALSSEEDKDLVKRIRSSGVRILFIGLGCPKQERWMAAHKGKIPAVMLGVGAAFDFLAKSKPQAPRWMRSSGLEWLFRLLTEPKRLWRRYLYHNPRFVALLARQVLRKRRGDELR